MTVHTQMHHARRGVVTPQMQRVAEREGLTPELVDFPEGFEKDVVRGVLGLLRVAQQAECQVIDRAAVLVVQLAKPGVQGRCFAYSRNF